MWLYSMKIVETVKETAVFPSSVGNGVLMTEDMKTKEEVETKLNGDSAVEDTIVFHNSGVISVDDEGEFGDGGSIDVSQYQGILNSLGEDTTQGLDSLSTYVEATNREDASSFCWEPVPIHEENNQCPNEEVVENYASRPPSSKTVVAGVNFQFVLAILTVDEEAVPPPTSETEVTSHHQKVHGSVVRDSGILSSKIFCDPSWDAMIYELVCSSAHSAISTYFLREHYVTLGSQVHHDIHDKGSTHNNSRHHELFLFFLKPITTHVFSIAKWWPNVLVYLALVSTGNVRQISLNGMLLRLLCSYGKVSTQMQHSSLQVVGYIVLSSYSVKHLESVGDEQTFWNVVLSGCNRVDSKVVDPITWKLYAMFVHMDMEGIVTSVMCFDPGISCKYQGRSDMATVHATSTAQDDVLSLPNHFSKMQVIQRPPLSTSVLYSKALSYLVVSGMQVGISVNVVSVLVSTHTMQIIASRCLMLLVTDGIFVSPLWGLSRVECVRYSTIDIALWKFMWLIAWSPNLSILMMKSTCSLTFQRNLDNCWRYSWWERLAILIRDENSVAVLEGMLSSLTVGFYPSIRCSSFSLSNGGEYLRVHKELIERRHSTSLLAFKGEAIKFTGWPSLGCLKMTVVVGDTRCFDLGITFQYARFINKSVPFVHAFWEDFNVKTMVFVMQFRSGNHVPICRVYYPGISCSLIVDFISEFVQLVFYKGKIHGSNAHLTSPCKIWERVPPIMMTQSVPLQQYHVFFLRRPQWRWLYNLLEILVTHSIRSCLTSLFSTPTLWKIAWGSLFSSFQLLFVHTRIMYELTLDQFFDCGSVQNLNE